jgi:CheY-like chemotaxis protein
MCMTSATANLLPLNVKYGMLDTVQNAQRRSSKAVVIIGGGCADADVPRIDEFRASGQGNSGRCHDEALSLTRGMGGAEAVDRAHLAGQTILVVEEQPLVSLDLRTALEQAGAKVMVARNATQALARINEFVFAAAVVDWRPDSEDRRVVARALKQKQVRFLFYATHPPEDVTTVRGAPIFLKPGCRRSRYWSAPASELLWILLQGCHSASLLSLSCYSIQQPCRCLKLAARAFQPTALMQQQGR